MILTKCEENENISFSFVCGGGGAEAESASLLTDPDHRTYLDPDPQHRLQDKRKS